MSRSSSEEGPSYDASGSYDEEGSYARRTRRPGTRGEEGADERRRRRRRAAWTTRADRGAPAREAAPGNERAPRAAGRGIAREAVDAIEAVSSAGRARRGGATMPDATRETRRAGASLGVWTWRKETDRHRLPIPGI